jgi:hypothetical protein
MKNLALFKKVIFIWIFLTSNALAVDYPNIPKDLDSNFCDKSGGRYGHVITIIDLTSDLKNAQIDFIKDQVFSREFYMSYTPFTKFSYILIDDKKVQEQNFLFTKCRPKTGDKRFSKKDAASFSENPKVLKKFSGEFFLQADKLGNSIFQNKINSKYSFIYETVAAIFQNPKSDFQSSKHRRKDLIIVSDMMQNSERLSFYAACNAQSDNAKCPSFNTFMNNLSDKDYMTATAPEGNNINLKMIYLNHRNETNKELDRSLKELWVEYFKSRNFKKVDVISQLDIN